VSTKYTPIARVARSALAHGAPRELTSLQNGKRDPAVVRLYEKAKRLGTWNPTEIDFRRDAADWAGLSDAERDLLLTTTAPFVAGEESVIRDLLPLGQVVMNEGRLDDELFLTAWLWEEGKHADFFFRFVDAVIGDGPDLGRFQTEGGRDLLERELPRVMRALLVDATPAAQTRALVTYCLIIEGVLAEAGHRVFSVVLDDRGLLPGLRAGLTLIRRDESRHVAYGMYSLSRLIRIDPANREVARAQVQKLVPTTLSVANEVLVSHPSAPPRAQNAFNKPLERLHRRLQRIESAAREGTWARYSL
jgi:ribonucleoside-diphosphate reductase beta chain